MYFHRTEYIPNKSGLRAITESLLSQAMVFKSQIADNMASGHKETKSYVAKNSGGP